MLVTMIYNFLSTPDGSIIKEGFISFKTLFKCHFFNAEVVAGQPNVHLLKTGRTKMLMETVHSWKVKSL